MSGYVKISQLPVATASNTTDVYVVNQSGVTKQISASIMSPGLFGATLSTYPGNLDWTADLAWVKNDAELKWNSDQTSASTRRPYLETDASLNLTLATPLDFPGAAGGSYPVGVYASHRQIGGAAANNAFTHSIMGYALNSAVGDNDVIATSGRATKTDVAGGIGDAAGVWGSAYQLSQQPGMVMALEGTIYSNVAGSTARDRLDNNTYATSVAAHLASFSTGSPATAVAGFQASGWGAWNGIILDAALFDHNGTKNGRAGTVGINAGSWSAGNGYPEIGVKFGEATWHIWRGNARVSVQTNQFLIANDAANGAAGYQVRSSGTGNAYIDLISGSTGRGQWFWDGTGSTVTFGTIGAIPLVFRTNETEYARIDSSGNVGIATNSPTDKLDVNSNSIRLRTARTPASATATGTQGQICWDSNYVYVCVATNTWKRAAISTW